MKNYRKKATNQMLKDYLSYDAETGRFTWIKTRGYNIKIGDTAGTKHSKNIADLSNLLYRDTEGVLKFNFGQHKDKPVLKNVGFANFMLQGNFPMTTKEVVLTELKGGSYIENAKMTQKLTY